MASITTQTDRLEQRKAAPLSKRGWVVFGRYALKRFLTIAITVVVAVYLTILIANLGGYVDEVIRGRLTFQLMGRVQGGWLSELPTEEREAVIERTFAAMEEAEGLNSPFLLRSLWWLGDGLLLDWGETRTPGSFRDTTTVRALIAENLARTLLIFGISNLLLLGASVLLALLMLRVRGRWLERLLVVLSPLSGAPAWVYGVLLTAVLINVAGISAGGTLDQAGELSFAYFRVVLRTLSLPLAAIFISGLLQSVYTWRAFFQVYADEPYVEMGVAKGLQRKTLERRYILRPALPTLLTGLALLIMTLWQEVIALEYFFNVAGIGRLLITAIRNFSTPIIVGLVVTFAYLLAITVFVLDILYAFVDPRIRVADSGNGAVATRARQRGERRVRTVRIPSLQGLTGGMRDALRQFADGFGRIWRQLIGYKTALVGLGIIAALILVSLVTVTVIPYDIAVARWRGETGEFVRNPRAALPTWVNLFRRNKLPTTLSLSRADNVVLVTEEQLSDDVTDILMAFPISYSYAEFPQELVLDFSAEFVEKAPHVVITLITPDLREIELTSFASKPTQTYFAGQDERLQRRLDAEFPQRALFSPEGAGDSAESALQGGYELQVSALLFEPDSSFDATMTLIGKVYGLAGTDDMRRDLMVPLLWGTPVALAFGLGAAVITSLFSLVVAALGAWFGGWLDRAIQFMTEVNLILPFFPVALLIFTLYSKSIWAILGVTVLLSLFGDSIKTYRAAFLQIKESSYVQAAEAYGASGWRIATGYLMPRMFGVLLPKLVLLVPGYVFLESTLAFLGVSDPVLPTWGKLIVTALSSNIYGGISHIVVLPLLVLFLTAFAFALVAYALEQIFQPSYE